MILRSTCTRFCAVALALAAAFAYRAAGQTVTAPVLFTLSPPSVAAGTPSFVLSAVGANFTSGAAILWNGSPLPTSFISSGQVIATVSPSLVTAPATVLVTVLNPNGQKSNQALFSVTAPALSITTTTLAAAQAGAPYAATLAASGGSPPYTWSSLNALPAGLVLNPNGTLSGTPSAAGSFTLGIRVTDAAQASASASLALTVNPPAFSIATNSALPAATAGQAYTQTLSASGGTPPLQWALGPGAPAGLALASATGVLSGTPAAPGTFTFTVQVTDSSQLTANKAFTLQVNPPPLMITTVPPLFSGTVGSPYSQTLTASGGTPPYRWSIVSGQAGGLTLDAAAGTLQGKPATAGTFSFTVQVTDNAGRTASQAFSVVVNQPALSITTAAALPNGAAGVAYQQTLSAAGGTPPYTWSILTGAIPGVTLNGSGVLAGTPTTAGTFNFTAQAKDAGGATGTKTFTLTVAAAALKLTSASQLPNATVAVPFSQAMSATGGVPPYAWSANGLPDGLTIDPATGLISGAPAAAGSFSFTVRVADATLANATDLFRITVGLPPLPAVSITGLPDSANPASQATFQVQLDAPYSAPISGQAVLSFAADTGAGDSTIQFSNGQRTAAFTIAAGDTAATFADNGLALQTGTVAGNIALTLALQAAGVDITPAPAPSHSIRIERAAPSIVSAKLVRSANGFSIEITGFSTAREVTQASFTFAASAGNTLQTNRVDVSVDALFGPWFQDPASSRFGSQFIFTQPFTTQGDANAVIPDSVTLTNRLGATTAKISP